MSYPSIRALLLGLVLMAPAAPLLAAIDAYQFDSTAQEERFQRLAAELRCLVCQNQSLADSNAGLAKDLRDQVHEMILAGKDDKEIVDYMVERYGDFVLYRPPVQANTWLLWFGPLALLGVGALALILFLRHRAAARATTAAPLSEAERERLAQLLEERK